MKRIVIKLVMKSGLDPVDKFMYMLLMKAVAYGNGCVYSAVKKAVVICLWVDNKNWKECL